MVQNANNFHDFKLVPECIYTPSVSWDEYFLFLFNYTLDASFSNMFPGQAGTKHINKDDDIKVASTNTPCLSLRLLSCMLLEILRHSCTWTEPPITSDLYYTTIFFFLFSHQPSQNTVTESPNQKMVLLKSCIYFVFGVLFFFLLLFNYNCLHFNSYFWITAFLLSDRGFQTWPHTGITRRTSGSTCAWAPSLESVSPSGLQPRHWEFSKLPRWL